jgi:hypothetical protein
MQHLGCGKRAKKRQSHPNRSFAHSEQNVRKQPRRAPMTACSMRRESAQHEPTTPAASRRGSSKFVEKVTACKQRLGTPCRGPLSPGSRNRGFGLRRTENSASTARPVGSGIVIFFFVRWFPVARKICGEGFGQSMARDLKVGLSSVPIAISLNARKLASVSLFLPIAFWLDPYLATATSSFLWVWHGCQWLRRPF